MNSPFSNIKTTASHTTLTEAAQIVVKIASKIDAVSKISIGIIKPTRTRGGRRDIKFLPVTGGIKAKVRGHGSVQELILYTKNSKEVAKLLTEKFLK